MQFSSRAQELWKVSYCSLKRIYSAYLEFNPNVRTLTSIISLCLNALTVILEVILE